ncbi:MAG: hypothetical protein IJ828_05560 [Treponema sp.]|nr:hypothetical protein [Treponema sp.]
MESREYFTSSRETLLRYDYVAQFLNLNKEDRDIDMRLINDAFQDIIFFIGRDLAFSEYSETKKIRQKKMVLDVFPVTEIINIVAEKHDAPDNAACLIDKSEYDFDSVKNTIIFKNNELNGKKVTVSYIAGFTQDSLPDDIKEAGLALFSRKHSMYKKAADYAIGDDMDDVIEQKIEDGLLDYDVFFDKFSEIPYEVEILLNKYKASL